MSTFKITFELTEEAAIESAIKSGSPIEEAKLFAMGIQRQSRFKQVVKSKNQYQVLNSYQNNGYKVIGIENI